MSRYSSTDATAGGATFGGLVSVTITRRVGEETVEQDTGGCFICDLRLFLGRLDVEARVSAMVFFLTGLARTGFAGTGGFFADFFFAGFFALLPRLVMFEAVPVVAPLCEAPRRTGCFLSDVDEAFCFIVADFAREEGIRQI